MPMVDPAHDDHGAPWRSPAGGPRLGDGVEEWPEERIQAEIDKRLEAQTVAGGEEIRTDGGNAHASNVAAQLRQAEADGGLKHPPLNVGDHVQETDGDATMLVVGLPSVHADAYEVQGGPLTVADYHDPKHAQERVIEAIYTNETDTALEFDDDDVYAYPRGVLGRVAAIHGDGGGDDE